MTLFYSLQKVKVTLKAHLTPNVFVASRPEMLAYERVRSAFNLRNALTLSVIHRFQIDLNICLESNLAFNCCVVGLETLTDDRGLTIFCYLSFTVRR